MTEKKPRSPGLDFGWSLFFILLLGCVPSLRAENPDTSRDSIRKAVEAGLRTLEKSAATYADRRSCFSCHHQTLPMQAMATARQAGFKIDEDLFRAQARFTHESFRSRATELKDGTGIGGKSMTVGYGLWALNLAHWERDDTTSAMIAYLLKTQAEDGRFWSNSVRPPLEDSAFTATTLVAFYMQKFAPAEKKSELEDSLSKAKRWLLDHEPKTQEDRNLRLWGLHLLGMAREQIDAARALVLASQRADGGWAQLADMKSDAYATGQTLFVLRETGTTVDHATYQRGIRFLLETQLEDGTWLVKTRSKPIQTFFESGFPHDKDQFISVCATSWAVAALAAAHGTSASP